MIDSIRLAIEPTACRIFPINLFWFPLIYLLVVFIFVFATATKGTGIVNLIKTSTIQMFRNAIIRHPSQRLTAAVFILVFILEYCCAFPVNKPKIED